MPFALIYGYNYIFFFQIFVNDRKPIENANKNFGHLSQTQKNKSFRAIIHSSFVPILLSFKDYVHHYVIFFFFRVDDVDGGLGRRLNTYEYFICSRMQANNHQHFAFL